MNKSVKSADRALDILELFASTDRKLALRDVVGILDLPKSSAFMLLGTLSARGYIERGTDDLYTLAATMKSGHWVGGISGRIYRTAQPHLDHVLAAQEETVILGAPTAALDIRLLSHRISPLAIRFEPTTNPVIPGWCSAMGHAILSRLPRDRIRRHLESFSRTPLTPHTTTDADHIIARLDQALMQGFSLNIDERFEGASGAAVPICAPDGTPHAALNCVTVTPRFRRKQTAIIESLMSAARQIEEDVFQASHLTTEQSA